MKEDLETTGTWRSVVASIIALLNPRSSILSPLCSTPILQNRSLISYSPEVDHYGANINPYDGQRGAAYIWFCTLTGHQACHTSSCHWALQQCSFWLECHSWGNLSSLLHAESQVLFVLPISESHRHQSHYSSSQWIPLTFHSNLRTLICYYCCFLSSPLVTKFTERRDCFWPNTQNSIRHIIGIV
jgi:hypothetical protein